MTNCRDSTGVLFVAAMLMMVVPCTKAQTPVGAPTMMLSPVGAPDMLPPVGAAPAPVLDCLTYLVNVSDCLSFVETGSKLTKPENGCCPELAGLLESQPICLCQLLGDTSSYGVQIDYQRALKLPDACSLTAPPVSLCSVAGVPVGVPTSSEGLATSPVGSMAPEGAAASPGSANRDIGASSTTTTGLTFLVGLAVAVSTTLFF